jgi:osmotically-inducible protein OsmY
MIPRNARTAAALAFLLCGLAAVPALAAQRPADSDISRWVRDALVQDPRVDSNNLNVECKGGIVVLTGRAEDLACEQYAVSEAEKIQGVVGVRDEIDMTPSFRSDVDIAQDVRHRLVNSAMIDSQDIQVDVDDGKVNLTGSAGTWVECTQAAMLAREVRGVRSVTNGLSVNFENPRSDVDIQNDAKAQFDMDVYLTGLDIEPSVAHGLVTLNGTVGNRYEKERAGEDAMWLPGVVGVVNHLTVEPSEDEGVRDKKPVLGDNALRDAVRDQILRDGRIDSAGVHIEADHGTIRLIGEVPYAYEKKLAKEDARDTVGVAWVDNQIHVTPEAREDQSVQESIEMDLDTDYLVGKDDIHVAVLGGVVTLTGTVKTDYEKSHAEEIALRERGVEVVSNHIDVLEPASSDADILKTIKDRISEDSTTFPVAEVVKVEVSNGVATLSGDVNSWSERARAEHLALSTPGVWAVRNRLKVAGYPYDWDGSDGLIYAVPGDHYSR